MDKIRLAALSDGVFAVAITLLVLDIKIPTEPMSNMQLWHEFQKLFPNIAAYVLSFCIVGILWSGHHTILNLSKAVDRTLIWINLLYLMVVAFMPFPTAVLANHYTQQFAIVLYSTMLLVVGILHRFLLHYIQNRPTLVQHSLPADLWRQSKKASLVGASCGVAAIAASFISVYVSLIFLFCVPIYYIFVNRTSDTLTNR